MMHCNEDLVSIITPAYNASSFISQTVESVQVQTHLNWEMLVVDDCSSDNTRAIVEQFAKNDSRINLIRRQTNRGPAAARNTAIKAANGRYIAFLDSDDFWLPLKLEEQLRFMEEVNAAISFTRFRRIREAGNRCGRLISIPHQLNYNQLLRNTAIANSTLLIDRHKTGAFLMPRTHCDDYALCLDILKRGFVAHGLQKDLMRYRVVDNSFSRNKVKYSMWVWQTYRKVEKLSLPYAAWCFVNYALRAYRKYWKF